MTHICATCAEVGIIVPGEDYYGGWLGQAGAEYLCADCRDRRAEHADEANPDAYYGGDTPVTLNEFCARAAADKRH